MCASHSHDIFRFQVKMRNLLIVHIIKRLQHLLDNARRLILRQLLAIGQKVEQLTARDQLQDQDHLIRILPRFLQLDNARMVQIIQNRYFTLDLASGNALS